MQRLRSVQSFFFHMPVRQHAANCLNLKTGWTAVFWRLALSHLPCRQTSTGQAPPPVRAANSCKLLICPKQTCLRFWAPLSHTFAVATTLPFPNLRSLSKKPSSSAPLHRRFPLHHPCFTLRDALLQVARNFEQFASKKKVKHGEGHMPDPMPLTNVSNSISPNGSADANDL